MKRRIKKSPANKKVLTVVTDNFVRNVAYLHLSEVSLCLLCLIKLGNTQETT